MNAHNYYYNFLYCLISGPSAVGTTGRRSIEEAATATIYWTQYDGLANDSRVL